MKAHHPIDFVLPWVDNTDKEWQKRFTQHSTKEGDCSEIRYRDWDLLRYWFRSIEQNTPWVNKIHFITSGELPEWLNMNHPKLNWIKHEDYIPTKYLPTFSSHPIELNLHRIKNLAEHFVYFNDDFFILKPIKHSRFFQNSLPCDYAVMTAKPASSSIIHIVINNLELLERNFDKHNIIKKNFGKWFNLKYRKGFINNVLLYPWIEFSGFIDPHIPYAYRKSTLSKIWEITPQELEQTSSMKFRSNNDINQWIIRYWQLAEGKFHPYNIIKETKCIDINDASESFICNAVSKQKFDILCLNDSLEIVNFEQTKKNIQQSFEQILPIKSSFELFL